MDDQKKVREPDILDDFPMKEVKRTRGTKEEVSPRTRARAPRGVGGSGGEGGPLPAVSRDEFAGLLERIQAAERLVRDAGQAEYAHDLSNIFANFDRLASGLDLTREQVLLVYAGKHWDGIVSWVKGHRSQREDVRGRIKDLRMYLALLWGMVEAGDRDSVLCYCGHPENMHSSDQGCHVCDCLVFDLDQATLLDS